VTLCNRIFVIRLSNHLHCTNRPFKYVLRGDMSPLRAGPSKCGSPLGSGVLTSLSSVNRGTTFLWRYFSR